jgi:hypothetical protein
LFFLPTSYRGAMGLSTKVRPTYGGSSIRIPLQCQPWHDRRNWRPTVSGRHGESVLALVGTQKVRFTTRWEGNHCGSSRQRTLCITRIDPGHPGLTGGAPALDRRAAILECHRPPPSPCPADREGKTLCQVRPRQRRCLARLVPLHPSHARSVAAWRTGAMRQSCTRPLLGSWVYQPPFVFPSGSPFQ